MAFDVYVGTLTRYYAGEWETAGERFARDNNLTYEILYTESTPGPRAPKAQISDAVFAWQKEWHEALLDAGYNSSPWEDGDELPYFTERPGWDGYGALLLWAAHSEHPEIVWPDPLPTSYSDDEAYKHSTDPAFESAYRCILEPKLWIPADFHFVTTCNSPSSVETCIGSTFELKRQLQLLLSQTRHKLETVCYPFDQRESQTVPGRYFLKVNPLPEQANGTSELAGEALAIFLDLAAKACEHRLSILLDY